MSDLDEFANKLKTLMAGRTDLRPFVCNGSPLTCEVIIVGVNAATRMKEGFWQFWLHGRGFDRGGWRKAYDDYRRKGTQRRTTRSILDRIAREIEPLRSLETNLYWVPTKRERQLRMLRNEPFRELRPFFELLKLLRPSIVVLHGRKAKRQEDAIRNATPELANSVFIPANKHLCLLTNDDIGKLIQRVRLAGGLKA